MTQAKGAPWQERSLCSQPDYSWAYNYFFGLTARDRRVARDICYTCPVREECLRAALERPEIWGVWGGLDEGELRRALGVDANGSPIERCRYPHCPRCRSRPNKLYIATMCEMLTGRRRESVHCIECGFTWKAATSVTAVRSYWKMVKNRQREQQREQALARRSAARAKRAEDTSIT